MPVLQSMADTWFGPFQIRWDHVLGIAAFGLVSSFLAAVVPAWIASRQDVVAVLAGRRGDRAASKRSPVIGLALTAAGIGVAVLGARRDSGETMIAGAAVLSVFGMIFLVPVVVLGVARLGRRFPLPLRYAVRDAARHRTRTVPAVAAVAATVAGVVALSIANTSDQAQAKADYVDQVPVGTGVVTDSGPTARVPGQRARRLSRRRVSTRTAVDGVPQRGDAAIPACEDPRGGSMAAPRSPSGPAPWWPIACRTCCPRRSVRARGPRAEAMLAKGGVVLFAQQHSSIDRTTLVVRHKSPGSGPDVRRI